MVSPTVTTQGHLIINHKQLDIHVYGMHMSTVFIRIER